jgi:hypothetical protein
VAVNDLLGEGEDLQQIMKPTTVFFFRSWEYGGVGFQQAFGSPFLAITFAPTNR